MDLRRSRHQLRNLKEIIVDDKKYAYWDYGNNIVFCRQELCTPFCDFPSKPKMTRKEKAEAVIKLYEQAFEDGVNAGKQMMREQARDLLGITE